MSVTLDPTGDGRIAVLHGVDTDAALRHLGRTLVDGAAFDGYRGIVIDLGGSRPTPATVTLLDDAGSAFLRHRRVIATVASSAEVPFAIARVRRWLDRFDRSATPPVPVVVVVRELAAVFGVAGAGVTMARTVMIRLVRGRFRP